MLLGCLKLKSICNWYLLLFLFNFKWKLFVLESSGGNSEVDLKQKI